MTVRTRALTALTGSLVLLASVAIVLVAALPSYAGNTPCTPGDVTCVGVGAGGGGGPGGDGGNKHPPGGGNRTGGKGKPDPCAHYPAGYHQICARNQGAGPFGCLALYDQYFGTMPLAEFNQFVNDNECPSVGAGAKPPPTPAQLAQRAAASFHLSLPSGHRSPSEHKDVGGYPFTYVNLWTFYWTDPRTWKSHTATASAGGNYATVTATPMLLTFNPGNGTRSVSCAGAGRAWQESDGNDAPSGVACAFQYAHITGPGYTHPVTSTQTIAWQLTWTGSDNTNGTLTARTTSTSGSLNVLQIQTVNR